MIRQRAACRGRRGRWLRLHAFALVITALSACSPLHGAGLPAGATGTRIAVTTLPNTAVGNGLPRPTASATLPPTTTPSPTLSPTGTATPTAMPTVSRLKAMVTAGLLSCRSGPGPDYLFLYGLRKGANIVLIGRTDANNWRWVYVEGRNKCWVKTDFLEIQGDWKLLPVVYPGIARLPVSPYYPPTTVLSVVRRGNQVTVEWLDIPLRAGDEEDAYMQHYIVEVWRCQNGVLLFEPLATNELSVSFTDQPGCSVPSHGRIFVQEKHGFAGPTDISWPPIQ